MSIFASGNRRRRERSAEPMRVRLPIPQNFTKRTLRTVSGSRRGRSRNGWRSACIAGPRVRSMRWSARIETPTEKSYDAARRLWPPSEPPTIRYDMCGCIGVYAPDGTDVFPDVYDALLAVQHRGQDAAGIITATDSFHAQRGPALVRDIFDEESA